MRHRFSHPSPALAIALLALFIALGGTGYAAVTAPSGPAGGDLTGTYPNPTIKAAAVTAAKVAGNALTGAQIDESTLGRVPNADKLDGLDSTGFTQGSAAIYHESLDFKTAPTTAKAGPPITIPDVGQFTFTCVDDAIGGTGVQFGVRYKNSTGGNQTVFLDVVGLSDTEYFSHDTAPGHHTIPLGGFASTVSYHVRILGASRLVELNGALQLGAGCRNAAQATFTN